MRALIIPVTPFQQNCSLIWDEDSRAARWSTREAISSACSAKPTNAG